MHWQNDVNIWDFFLIVHTQILFVLASDSVITLIASFMLFHGVLGLPPLKKIQRPASNKSFVNNPKKKFFLNDLALVYIALSIYNFVSNKYT